MTDSLSLPLVFVGHPNWQVLHQIAVWPVEHWRTLVVFGLRWVAVSLFVACAFSIWMHYFKHKEP